MVHLGVRPEEIGIVGYDVMALRAGFSSLQHGTAHFDGPGGSQVPDAVANAVAAAMTSPISNRGRTTQAERNADLIVVAARAAAADLLNADPDGIVFGRSMTQLTFDLARTLSRTWTPGDEVVVTRLDHDANIRPWVLAAQAVGAVVRWADFDPATGELEAQQVTRWLGPRTRLVAVTAASNLIGTKPPVTEIASAAHEVGALVFVDGVHATPHVSIDVDALGADLFVCSPYKFLGPHCGMLAGSPELLAGLQPEKLLPSADVVPERYELGTLPYELLAGTTAAVEVIAGLADPGLPGRRDRLVAAMSAVQAHEDRLLRRVETGLSDLPGLQLHSRAGARTPTLLVTVGGRDMREAYEFLAARGINAPAGSFYALEASRHLGLGDAGGLRIGLASYSDDADVDRLLAAMAEFCG